LTVVVANAIVHENARCVSHFVLLVSVSVDCESRNRHRRHRRADATATGWENVVATDDDWNLAYRVASLYYPLAAGATTPAKATAVKQFIADILMVDNTELSSELRNQLTTLTAQGNNAKYGVAICATLKAYPAVYIKPAIGANLATFWTTRIPTDGYEVNCQAAGTVGGAFTLNLKSDFAVNAAETTLPSVVFAMLHEVGHGVTLQSYADLDNTDALNAEVREFYSFQDDLQAVVPGHEAEYADGTGFAREVAADLFAAAAMRAVGFTGANIIAASAALFAAEPADAEHPAGAVRITFVTNYLA